MRPPLPLLLLLPVGLGWVAAGLAATVQPQAFFDTVPGLPTSGLFHPHLVRDVGLAFLVSGVMVPAGAYFASRTLVAAGALWPLLHSLFHVTIWFNRGCAVDGLFGFDLVAVIIPALVAAAVAWRWPEPRS